MKTTMAVTTLLALFSSTPSAHADSFGSGANAFDIEFVTIGNPNNPPDPTDDFNPPRSFAGAVNYSYRIGKYEISREMITKANEAGGLGITLDLLPAVSGGPRPEMPATGITWYEAARFVNWLNTSNGHAPAYKFSNDTFEPWRQLDPGFDPANPFRHADAVYFLPSKDEWYKAAYFDPTAGVYNDYPTGSDTAPTAVAGGTAAGTAIYSQGLTAGPADVTMAGGLSPYGTMGQGGNASELEETEFDMSNDSTSGGRGIRGSWWGGPSSLLQSSNRNLIHPGLTGDAVGFRVASVVPEPNTLLLAAITSAAAFVRRRDRISDRSAP